MPEPNERQEKLIPKKNCEHTVGDGKCQECVNNGKCPSNFTTVEEIDSVERGREYCLGKA